MFVDGINVPLGPAWAEWDDVGQTGRVCAAGRAMENGEAADHVILKVEPGQPGVHPTMPSGPIVPVNDISGLWGPFYVDGVTDHPNQTPHAIYCWAKFSHGYVEYAANPFTPIWTSYPYCDYPAHSGSSTNVASKSSSFDVLPKAWHLETMGFSGKDVASFNGMWELMLRPGSTTNILYCNGGNGTTIPQIQIHCELPKADTWTISFRLGDTRVSYSLAEGDFNPQSVNIFRNATSSGVDELSGIPAAIKVIPK